MTHKRLKEAYEKYKWKLTYYGQRDLDSVYQSCSNNKRVAWQYCRDKCYELNGSHLSIVSYNCHAFTAGFTFNDEAGKKCFEYITKGGDYTLEVGDE